MHSIGGLCVLEIKCCLDSSPDMDSSTSSSSSNILKQSKENNVVRKRKSPYMHNDSKHAELKKKKYLSTVN